MEANDRREAIAKAVYEAWYTPMRWPENTTMQSRDAGYRAADAVLAALAELENAQVHPQEPRRGPIVHEILSSPPTCSNCGRPIKDSWSAGCDKCYPRKAA